MKLLIYNMNKDDIMNQAIKEDIDEILNSDNLNKMYINIVNFLEDDKIEEKHIISNSFSDKLIDEISDRSIKNEIENPGKIDEIAEKIGNTKKINKTKTRFKEEYERSKTDKFKEEGDIKESEPLNIWFKQNIEEIIKIESTDSITDTKYQFKFKGYDKFIETEKGYKSSEAFIDLIFDLTTKRISQPEMDSEPHDDWINFIRDYITKNHEIKTYKGSRTLCIEDIKNKINTSNVYKEKETIRKENIYYDEKTGKLYVPSKIIKNIVEDQHFLNNEAIQSELDNRNIINGSVSKVLSIDGNKYRCWVFPETFCNFEVTEKKEDDIMKGI